MRLSRIRCLRFLTLSSSLFNTIVAKTFLCKCSLEQRLDIARQMVRDREFELRELLASRPSLRAQYRKQLSGTSLA